MCERTKCVSKTSSVSFYALKPPLASEEEKIFSTRQSRIELQSVDNSTFWLTNKPNVVDNLKVVSRDPLSAVSYFGR